MQHNVLTIVKHQWLWAKRQPALWVTPLLFFILANSFFAMILSPYPQRLNDLGPGMIWITMLLASLLSLQTLLQQDEVCLPYYIVAPTSLPLLLLGKIMGAWLTQGLPLVLTALLVGLFYHLTLSSKGILLLTLLLGTPIFMLVGAIGCALTIGLKGRGFLLPIIIFPLLLPIVLLGTSTVSLYQLGLPIRGELALLASGLIASTVVAPWLTAAALRLGVQS